MLSQDSHPSSFLTLAHRQRQEHLFLLYHDINNKIKTKQNRKKLDNNKPKNKITTYTFSKDQTTKNNLQLNTL